MQNNSKVIIAIATKLHTGPKLINSMKPCPLRWSCDFYIGASDGQANFRLKPIFSNLATNSFSCWVIKHILFAKNPGWPSIDPFAAGENGHFLISVHH